MALGAQRELYRKDMVAEYPGLQAEYKSWVEENGYRRPKLEYSTRHILEHQEAEARAASRKQDRREAERKKRMLLEEETKRLHEQAVAKVAEIVEMDRELSLEVGKTESELKTWNVRMTEKKRYKGLEDPEEHERRDFDASREQKGKDLEAVEKQKLKRCRTISTRETPAPHSPGRLGPG